MANISTFDNFFDKFPSHQVLRQKGYHYGRNEHILQSKISGQYCHISLCTFSKTIHICLGYETLTFLFLEHCFQLSLSDEIGYTFFDIVNFSRIFLISVIWWELEKMLIYLQSIIFYRPPLRTGGNYRTEIPSPGRSSSQPTPQLLQCTADHPLSRSFCHLADCSAFYNGNQTPNFCFHKNHVHTFL